MDGLGLVGFILVELLGKRFIFAGEDLDGQEGSVFGTGRSYADGGDGDTGGHLDGR